jgi:hypothetical protein
MEDGGGSVVTAESPRDEAERREEERYPVSWAAEIFIPERTTMFRGRVVNISPSGCYVQTVAWVRVPPATLVELVFLLDGRMNRVHAEARYAQSRTGVGLRFLALEQDIRRRLDDVIDQLCLPVVDAAVAVAEEQANSEPIPGGDEAS